MTKITRRQFVASTAVAGAGLALGLNPASAQAAYPNRPIQMICPWGAGGGTDATARIVAALLEKDVGQPVNVVNRTGGSGVVGHQAIASSPADGYTIGLITVEIAMMHWQGLTPLTYADFTTIGLVNSDPAGVNVRADAPYKNVKDLLAAVKANPGKFKASGTGQGGIWHLAIAGLLKEQGIDPSALPWVPSNGAAPGLQDLVAGGVEVAPCSLPEARSLIDAGKVKPLAIMDADPSALYPKVPTLKKELGSNWTMAAWRVIAAPKGMPADMQARLVATLKKVHDSKEFRDFMAQRGYGVVWAAPQDAVKFMAKSDADLGAVMKSVGIAK
jgi:tripartite-type tricarboxylate transporter receptor subunit TctC